LAHPLGRVYWKDITCTSFAGDGIEAITGHNPFDAYRGAFDNQLGAIKVIKQRGFETLDQLIGSLFDEVPIGLAQVGDLVLVKAEYDLDIDARTVMPHGVALADSPMYWCVVEGGLASGQLYVDGFKAFAVGRDI
jgi:hypothetical protein